MLIKELGVVESVEVLLYICFGSIVIRKIQWYKQIILLNKFVN